MGKDLNKNIKARDEIIFGDFNPYAYLGGIRRFKGLTVDKLELLIQANFVDVDTRQNYAPSIQELLDFAKIWGKDSYVFDGYTVIDTRPDYRVSIDGFSRIASCFESDAEERAFENLCRDADEFDLDKADAWWD